jgi:hypothetical protein
MKYKIYLVWSLILLLVPVLLLLLFFNVGHSFISSTDGDGYKKNYYELTYNYRLLKGENSICENKKNTRVIPNVDSLNWDSNLLTGFYRGKYFIITNKTQKIETFETRKDFINNLEYLPSNKLEFIHGIAN